MRPRRRLCANIHCILSTGSGTEPSAGYLLLDPLAFWVLAGQEESFDELALTAYRHA